MNLATASDSTSFDPPVGAQLPAAHTTRPPAPANCAQDAFLFDFIL